MKRKQRVFVGVLLLLVALIGRTRIFRPSNHYPGNYFNQGKNAVWLEISWVNDPHTPDEIHALAEDLARYQVRYVFAYTSYLGEDGEFNPTYEYAEPFIRQLKAAYPEVRVLAWIGIPLTYVDLSDSATRQFIIAFAADLIPLGFDGIHYDPEQIADGYAPVLVLLDETRQRLGGAPVLSIATRHISPYHAEWSFPVANRFLWSAGYYQQIAARVDQIALMTYDSIQPHPLLYRQWTRFEVIEITRALRAADVEILIGIPTWEEKTFGHNPYAENMESGLRGVIAGLNDKASFPAVFTGVAIYPYWETDAAEWQIYARLWLGDE